MKSLVIPVNFSDCSICAARYAADMASNLHSEIHLINVVSTPYTHPDMITTEDIYNTMIDSAKKFLKEMQADLILRTAGKIEVHLHVETGSIYDQVKNLCDRLQPYAIILGSSGPTFEKLIGGSPVTSLLHLPYPVLVIPEHTSFHQFQRIALACDVNDLQTGLTHSMPILKELRQRFHARIDIITVENWKNWTEEQYYFLSQAWKTQLKDLEPEIHQVHQSHVAKGINDYLAAHPADLVIVFPKKHSLIEFHPSQSRKFAKQSKVPVMSLHES